jgi:hypothetical protein
MEGSHYVVFSIEVVFLLISKSNLAATVFREEDNITFLDIDGS